MYFSTSHAHLHITHQCTDRLDHEGSIRMGAHLHITHQCTDWLDHEGSVRMGAYFHITHQCTGWETPLLSPTLCYLVNFTVHGLPIAQHLGPALALSLKETYSGNILVVSTLFHNKEHLYSIIALPWLPR